MDASGKEFNDKITLNEWKIEYVKSYKQLKEYEKILDKEFDEKDINSFIYKLQKTNTLDKQSLEHVGSTGYLDFPKEIISSPEDYIPLSEELKFQAMDIQKKLNLYELWFIRTFYLLKKLYDSYKQPSSFGRKNRKMRFGLPEIATDIIEAIADADMKNFEKKLKILLKDEDIDEIKKQVSKCVRNAYLTKEYKAMKERYEEIFKRELDVEMYVVKKTYIERIKHIYSGLKTYYYENRHNIEKRISITTNKIIQELLNSKSETVDKKQLRELEINYREVEDYLIFIYTTWYIEPLYKALEHFTNPLVL